MVLLGSVLVLLGGLPAIWLFYTQPTSPIRDLSPKEIQQELERRSPTYTWYLYRDLRRQGPERDPLPGEATYAKELLQHRIYAGSLLLVACVGIGLIVVGVAGTRRKRV